MSDKQVSRALPSKSIVFVYILFVHSNTFVLGGRCYSYTNTDDGTNDNDNTVVVS